MLRFSCNSRLNGEWHPNGRTLHTMTFAETLEVWQSCWAQRREVCVLVCMRYKNRVRVLFASLIQGVELLVAPVLRFSDSAIDALDPGAKRRST